MLKEHGGLPYANVATFSSQGRAVLLCQFSAWLSIHRLAAKREISLQPGEAHMPGAMDPVP